MEKNKIGLWLWLMSLLLTSVSTLELDQNIMNNNHKLRMKMQNRSLVFILIIILFPSSVLGGTITRTFSSPIYLNQEVTIQLSVDVDPNNTFYIIEEHIPEGFTIIDKGTAQNNVPTLLTWVKISQLQDTTYIYTIKAASSPGSYSFNGIYMMSNSPVVQDIIGQNIEVIPLLNQCSTQGDFNANCVVNYVDAALLESQWRSNSPIYDLDNSNVVDYPDLEIMQKYYVPTYDINNDKKLNLSDIVFLDSIFNKEFEDPSYQPIADLFLDGKIDSLDYSLLVGQIPSDELNNNSIHKNQLLNVWMNWDERADIFNPIYHIPDYSFYWAFSLGSKNGANANVPLYSDFKLIAPHTLTTHYISGTTCYDPEPPTQSNLQSFYKCQDWSTNGFEDWFMHYTNNGTVPLDCHNPTNSIYQIDDRVSSFCGVYTAGDRYYLAVDKPGFPEWAGNELVGPFLNGTYYPGPPVSFWDGIAMDNVFYGLNYFVDTDYGPTYTEEQNSNFDGEPWSALWRQALDIYTNKVKKKLNANNLKLFVNTGGTASPYSHIFDLSPFIDGVLDEGISTRTCWRYGQCGDGFLGATLDNYEELMKQNKIILMMAFSKNAGTSGGYRKKYDPNVNAIGYPDYYDSEINFKGVTQEFFYSYALYHMVKDTGRIYFSYEFNFGGTSEDPFWIKDLEITNIGSPISTRQPLDSGDNSIPEFPNRHHIYRRDFQNGIAFIRDMRDPLNDPLIVTYSLPPVYNGIPVTWYNRLGEKVTSISLKPFDGAFVYTFNPFQTIGDLNYDKYINDSDRQVLLNRMGSNYSYPPSGSLYELSYDLNLDGVINNTDIALFDLYRTDADNDGILDDHDNCINNSNPKQEDADMDNKGDACDNCLNVPNADQLDTDGDSRGNACDSCPNMPNADQLDTDGDSRGNACDSCLNTPTILPGNAVPNSNIFTITDLTNQNLNSIFFEIKRNSIGTIHFNRALDVLIDGNGCYAALNLDNYVTIEQNRISANSTNLTTFNQPARLTFFNVNFQDPVIFKDGISCSDCVELSYNQRIYVVNIPSFSTYEIREGFVFTGGPASEDGSPSEGGRLGRTPECRDGIDNDRDGKKDYPRDPGCISLYDTSELNINKVRECGEQWMCELWSICKEGKQTRECTDLNSCGTTVMKPIIEQTCDQSIFFLPLQEQIEDQNIKSNLPYFLFALVGLVVLILGGEIIRRKKMKIIRIKHEDIYDLITKAEKNIESEKLAAEYYNLAREIFERNRADYNKKEKKFIERELLDIYWIIKREHSRMLKDGKKSIDIKRKDK